MFINLQYRPIFYQCQYFINSGSKKNLCTRFEGSARIYKSLENTRNFPFIINSKALLGALSLLQHNLTSFIIPTIQHIFSFISPEFPAKLWISFAAYIILKMWVKCVWSIIYFSFSMCTRWKFIKFKHFCTQKYGGKGCKWSECKIMRRQKRSCLSFSTCSQWICGLFRRFS